MGVETDSTYEEQSREAWQKTREFFLDAIKDKAHKRLLDKSSSDSMKERLNKIGKITLYYFCTDMTLKQIRETYYKPSEDIGMMQTAMENYLVKLKNKLLPATERRYRGLDITTYKPT